MPLSKETKNPYVLRNLPQWRKMRWLVLLLLLPLLMAVYGTVLLFVYELLFSPQNNALLHIKPAMGAWYFVGMVLSVGTTGLWMNKIYQVYQKTRFKPFPFETLKPVIEGFPVSRLLAWIFCLAALIFTVLIYDNYIIIYNDRMVIDKFMDFGEKSYALKEIQSISFIQQVKRGTKLKHSPHHIVRFINGDVYETRDNMLDDEAAIELLSKQTGKPIDTLLTRPQ